MKTIKFLLVVLMVICISCEKEEFDGVQNIEIYAIRSVANDSKTTKMFIYNSIVKIAEEE